MRPGIALRPDYDAARLRALAKATRNAGQSRRLLALAEIYDGGSRTRAARVGGVGLQTLRDWVGRFNARGPEGLIDGKAPGNSHKLNDAQRQALAEMVVGGAQPTPSGRAARRRGTPPPWSSPEATRSRRACIWRRSRKPSPREPMPLSGWTEPDGTVPRTSSCPTISRWCCCQPERPS